MDLADPVAGSIRKTREYEPWLGEYPCVCPRAEEITPLNAEWCRALF
jgi:hypothetical protein